jgi:hypothetical protein
MDLIKLADAIEAMSGGSSDVEVGERRRVNEIIHNLMPEPKVICPPDYCASLDAAMTLAGGLIGLALASDQNDRWHCELSTSALEGDGEARAASIPLAICAAALRARASQGEQS